MSIQRQYAKLTDRTQQSKRTFARVPMQKRLAPKHGRKLLRNAFEQLLNGRRIANECAGHFQSSRWDIANGRLTIVRDPLDEVAGILVLYVQHLFVHLFHGHSAAKNSRHGEILRNGKSFQQIKPTGSNCGWIGVVCVCVCLHLPCHVAGHRPPSYSWHRTFAGPIRAPSTPDIAASRATSAAQSPW